MTNRDWVTPRGWRRGRAVVLRTSAVAAFVSVHLSLGVQLAHAAGARADAEPEPQAQDTVTIGPSAAELEILKRSLEADTKEPKSSTAGASPATTSEAGAGSRSSDASTSVFGQIATGITGAVQSMNPDMAVNMTGSAAYFSRPNPLTTGGHDPRQRGFNLQALELAMGANVDSYLRFDGTLVMGPSLELEEAYGTTLGLPANLQVRAGQMMTRIGRANPTHPHAWDFADQPLMLGQLFGAEGSRGVGAEVSWLSPLPWYAEVILMSARGGGATASAAGPSGAGSESEEDEEQSVTKDFRDLVYTAALVQFFPLSDDWSLRWGATGQLAANDLGDGDGVVLAATDIYLRYKPLRSDRRQSLSLTIEALGRQRNGSVGEQRDFGGYAQLVWQWDPRWQLGIRVDEVRGELAAATSAEADPSSEEAVTARSHRERYAAELAFLPSHFSRLRLQASYDRPSWRDKGIIGVLVVLDLTAGAHGSHAY